MRSVAAINKLAFVFVLAAGLGLAGLAMATTWADSKIDCPVCQKQIEVKEVASFGTYIYRWASRLQMLFWPFTDDASLYFCRHCHAAWLMGDLQQLTEKQRQQIAKAIEPRRAKQAAVPYTEVPLAYRLDMAELTYQQIGENDFFWNHFYRVKGYHLDAPKTVDEAKRARLKSLEITERMLRGELDQAQHKELLLTKGSMLYLTGKRDAALQTLKRARAAPVEQSTNLSAEKARSIADFLNEIIDELVAHADKNEPLPR
jgi:hypothetical protein